ncbi:heparinase II/III family protein [candidate division KSB1 bacterium]|nr:heparinase II/III family protein [candidate division KSB1 bacterium]
MRNSWFLILILFTDLLMISCQKQTWNVPKVYLSSKIEHPFVSCTSSELERLRDAYRGDGATHAVIAEMIAQCDPFLDEPVEFPERGGQHNQWYQCEACQIALQTLDDTHHQCPECRRIYSGEPYDDVIFSRKHTKNLWQMNDAAWAYAITGKIEYAEYCVEVLSGYADRYSSYPYHSAHRDSGNWSRISGGHLFEQTLNEAYAMSHYIAPAYDLIYNSGILSPKKHAHIKNNLLLPMLENIDRNKAGKSNWQTWHNAAMIWAGALLGDANWINKAIADSANGFAYQMQVSVSDEGLWYENSWGYHFYTLNALVHIAECARRLGADLWAHPVMRKMALLPLEYAMPDGSLPRFGDDVNSSIAGNAISMEAIYHAFKSEAIRAQLPAEPTFESILLGRETFKLLEPASGIIPQSSLFRNAGHAILRSRGNAALTAVMTFGPYGGFHGHLDKLSFVFFGFGEELGVDPGRAKSQAYRLPIHKNWYKASLSHNTVLVNQQSQQPASGRLDTFFAGETCSAVSASCSDAYAGVEHCRLLLLAPTYLLIYDTLESNTEQEYDWVYRNRGHKLICNHPLQRASVGTAFPGAIYIQNIQQGTIDDDFQIQFIDEKVTTYLTMAGSPGTMVRIGDGPGESITDRIPMCMIHRRGKRARFVAVLEPVPAGSVHQIRKIRFNDDYAKPTIEILTEKRLSKVVIEPEGKPLFLEEEI